MELAKYSIELNILKSFLFIAELYMNGIYVKENIILAAIYLKIAADKGDIYAMNQYANILMSIVRHENNFSDIQKCIQNAKLTIFANNFVDKNHYIKAQLVFDTIDNDASSLFVAIKYYERAAQKGNENADQSLKLLKENFTLDDNIPLYFEKLC